MTFKNNDHYVGSWTNDKMQGYGQVHFKRGDNKLADDKCDTFKD